MHADVCESWVRMRHKCRIYLSPCMSEYLLRPTGFYTEHQCQCFRPRNKDLFPLFPVGGGGGLLPPANEVWGKVIFLHQFVILFTGGGVPGRYTPPGQVHPLRAGTPLAWAGTPPRAGTPPLRYGQRAGGTHPTGMQSCLCSLYEATVDRRQRR